MPAMKTDQRRERIAVDHDEPTPGVTRSAADQIEQRRRHGAAHGYCATAIAPLRAAARRASIWSMAETTASNVSMVEACRAL